MRNKKKVPPSQFHNTFTNYKLFLWIAKLFKMVRNEIFAPKAKRIHIALLHKIK